ncbi:hypothetical protein LptCag_1325 [Leptospirillum ferriphilum]|uniref:Uncharacterized protein n=1 Tax=Leptospirillum ferriphilum TaxID=178606 RepID=A0A094W664_9BACT|nr:hypothetical protein LptCag_1325 [Leptospirillum ferriphilum]
MQDERKKEVGETNKTSSVPNASGFRIMFRGRFQTKNT